MAERRKRGRPRRVVPPVIPPLVISNAIEIESCARLWRAVILRLLLDAKPVPAHEGNPRYIAELAAPRGAAREWFLSRSQDFDAVCGCAGIDPDLVLATALRLISGEPRSPITNIDEGNQHDEFHATTPHAAIGRAYPRRTPVSRSQSGSDHSIKLRPRPPVRRR